MGDTKQHDMCNKKDCPIGWYLIIHYSVCVVIFAFVSLMEKNCNLHYRNLLMTLWLQESTFNFFFWVLIRSLGFYIFSWY